MKEKTIAVWFSCGAASAVALHETLWKYGNTHNIRVLNNPIKEEHEDNQRFLHDVAKWLNVKIEHVVNPSFRDQSCIDVWESRRFMNGIAGAPCTFELKKRARYMWEAKNQFDKMVLGFTSEEYGRYEGFKNFEDARIEPVLIDARITKKPCYEIINKAGIKLPEIYNLGYPNANCIGCVKATSPTYWNHVRKVHPLVFEERAELSAELGAKLVRYKGERILLKDLPKDAKGAPMKNMDFEGGIFCKKGV
jgi:3'-phosphoadenosine 5'-phosphosulfate sulfotransferase (PAPS reductase)/FAD synthetase